MDANRENGQIFLGGISMSADDMITYIKNDLRIFGQGVIVLLILILGLFFKSKRWIILTIL